MVKIAVSEKHCGATFSANNIVLSQNEMLTRRCEPHSRVPFPEGHIMVRVRDSNGYP